MWLYHGTYDMFYKDIVESKKLVPNKNQDSTTIALDNFINNRANRHLRGGCIYLSDDKKVMDEFDRYFRVSTSKLDLSKLFVADNSQLDYILMYANTAESLKYADAYIESYVPFNVYMKYLERYRHAYTPEFIYFGEIAIGRKVGLIHG